MFYETKHRTFHLWKDLHPWSRQLWPGSHDQVITRMTTSDLLSRDSGHRSPGNNVTVVWLASWTQLCSEAGYPSQWAWAPNSVLHWVTHSFQINELHYVKINEEPCVCSFMCNSWYPMHCGLLCPWMFQARGLKQVAFSISRGSSSPRDQISR